MDKLESWSEVWINLVFLFLCYCPISLLYCKESGCSLYSLKCFSLVFSAACMTATSIKSFLLLAGVNDLILIEVAFFPTRNKMNQLGFFLEGYHFVTQPHPKFQAN